MSTDWKEYLQPKPGEQAVPKQFPDVLQPHPDTPTEAPAQSSDQKQIVELHDQVKALENKVTALEVLGKRAFGYIQELEQRLQITPEQSTKVRPEIWQAIMEFYEPARQQWQLVMENREQNPNDWQQWLEPRTE